MSRRAPSFGEIMTGTHESKKRFKLRQMLANNNNCKIWIGGSENDRVDYPYRLTPANKITDRIRNAATELMIDSGINDPSVTNETVIEKAVEYNAQWVIPKDYLGEIDRSYESTVEFIELLENVDYGGNVMVPLQPPHTEHYKKYEEFYSQFSHFAVGGIKNKDPETQIQAVKDLRELLGPYKHIHGLGMGCSEKIIDEIIENKDLLDSMDTNTFEQLPGKRGKLAGSDWKQKKVSLPNGKDSSTLSAIATELLVYQANYQLTPFVNRGDNEEQVKTEEDQMTLDSSWKEEPSKLQEESPEAANSANV